MSNQKANSVDRFARRDSAGKGFRAGVAKDQLIFIIICSAALAVAAVTLVHFFTGSSPKLIATSWQCLNCDNEFSKKTSEHPPIECPKCGGEAVRVIYRKCPNCGAKVMSNRIRLSERGKAQRDAMMKQAESTDQPVAARPMMKMPMDMETQYWIKQADGSYGWTDWLGAMSPQLAIQLENNMRCSECDALMFPRSSRTGRSGN